MSNITVPKSVKVTLEKIALMSSVDFETIEKLLALAQPDLDVDKMLLNVGALPAETSMQDFEDIVRCVLRMNMAQIEANVPTDNFIADILEVFERDVELTETYDQAIFKQRLQSLFGLEKVSHAARAQSVQDEYDAVYVSARIFSDIRPVFDQSGTTAISALVVHSLRIHYHQNSDGKEIYLALNNEELATLKKVIERAEKKHAALKDLIQKSKLNFFET